MSEPTAPTENLAKNKPAQKARPYKAIGVATILVAALAVIGGHLYWNAENFAETDNAFVTGHVHPIAARINGVVVEMSMQDNASVKAGSMLLKLDPADALVQIERLKAQIAQAQAQISASGAQIAQARAQTSAASAQIAQSDAVLARTELDASRAQKLYSGELRAVSRQEVDAANAARDVAKADLAARKASAQASAESIGSANANRAAALAQVAALEAQLKDAQQQLGYTTIMAPSDGRIGKRTVEVGQRVQPGQQLAAVVEGDNWVVANFKETQLARMHPGQIAAVHIDAFPNKTLHASIESFAPASGATFALLPPDNATGNFTKVVQRVPVKLIFDAKELAQAGVHLVPGLSASVAVDLRSQKGQEASHE